MTYDTLIDAETWAFIKETETYYPPETATADIATQRAVYNKMCRAFFTGYPQGVHVRDEQAQSVPIRVYEKGDHDTTMVYFHGGGFVVGGLESHDDICAELCDRCGLRVVSVDYRLSPEHKHPAAFNDAMDATQYVALTCPNSIILAGDSAGGNLASAVAHATRDTLNVAGVLLIYPGLGGDISQGSYQEHAHAPMLSLQDIMFYSDIRFERGADETDVTAAPLKDTHFSNLPPTVIFTAQCDPLADDGHTYQDAIVADGGQARWINEAGLIHGYLRARHTVKRARDSFERIITAAKMLANHEWDD